MQRVLYITKSRLSFSRAHTRNVVKTAEYLYREDGIAVTVFCAAAEPKTKEDIFTAKEVQYPYHLDLSPHKRSLIKAVFARRNDFDVLYFRDPALWRVAWLVKKWWGKRIVFEVHGSEEWGTKAPWKKSVALADGLVFMTEKLRAYYNPIAPHCVTHCNGNDEEQKKAQDTDMLRVRDALNLPREKTLVGITGSFQWDSRELLLSMLPLLPAAVELVLVGIKEGEVDAVREQARTLNVEERIHIVTRVPAKDVFSYMLSVDILVNPLIIAYPGSLSSKLYEYLAAGKPIVSSKGGANEEVIEHGKNGVIVDPPTSENFAHAIEGILADAAFGDALSHYAAVSAKPYTWGARARCIAEVLRLM
jgi:glycosyltransferase involved in cell wall biosynthesis